MVGTHAFATIWSWAVLNVHVADLRNSSRTVDFHSVAYVAPPGMAGSGLTITPNAGETFSGAVALYSGLDTDALDQYTATIQWGDGEPPATGNWSAHRPMGRCWWKRDACVSARRGGGVNDYT